MNLRILEVKYFLLYITPVWFYFLFRLNSKVFNINTNLIVSVYFRATISNIVIIYLLYYAHCRVIRVNEINQTSFTLSSQQYNIYIRLSILPE